MTTTNLQDVLIIGGGPAGLGIGLALQTLGLQNFVILERHEVGASFRRWPREMRMITPSFNAHAFGYLDLNAIAPRTSPAFTLKMEHPDGKSYAQYLQRLSEYFELPVETGVNVSKVLPESDGSFRVLTSQGERRARFVVWAAGEFQYPRRPAFPGAELCLHNSQVKSWQDVEGEKFVVIGGYESGIDAAIHLVRLGKQVQVLERSNIWHADGQDPSTSLSPFTLERMHEVLLSNNLDLLGGVEVKSVTQSNGEFIVHTSARKRFYADTPPVLATGFEPSARLIETCFAWREDGLPELTEQDESTLMPGLFLVGPSVRQSNVIFCFIYKFRQRFAVVARTIGERLGLDVEPLEEYRAHGMYLDDLSCCGEVCAC
jgi:thioredoxin reductase